MRKKSNQEYLLIEAICLLARVYQLLGSEIVDKNVEKAATIATYLDLINSLLIELPYDDKLIDEIDENLDKEFNKLVKKNLKVLKKHKERGKVYKK